MKKRSGLEWVQAGSIYLARFFAMFKHAFREAGEVKLTAMAGSLAYTTVLSIVPLLAVMFYVFKIFGGLEYAYARILPFLLDNLSEGSGEVVQEHLQNFVKQVQASAVGWAGIAGLLITAISTYFTVSACFSQIWKVTQKRRLRYRVFRALTLIIVGPVLLLASIAVTTAIATQVGRFPFSGPLFAMVLSTALFSTVYALVPMVKVPFKTIVKGSILPAVLWEGAKFGYAIYTKKVVSYSTFYGSFAAIPLFLLWIYIGWCITLFGAVWVHTIQIWQRR